MEFCSREMGSPFSSAGGGSADRKSLNSGCAPSTSLSTFFSSGPLVHSMVKWMFCSSTQPPFLCALFRLFIAMGSWPWPSDTDAYLPVSAVKPSFLPSASTLPATSTPGDRNTKMGTPGEESWYERSRSYGCEVTYCLPIMLVTNLVMAAVRRSGRSARKTSSRSNSGMRRQSPGMPSSSGRSFLTNSDQRVHEPCRSSGRLEYSSSSLSACTLPHTLSLRCSASGLSTPMTLGPRMRKSNFW
mmetsp:Transcript_13357/g.32647  ORF Transcript_13357/g.32647 Transcript_13357/m.32647 type:complete len:243 (-) Transcript_13357:2822-3550(-)